MNEEHDYSIPNIQSYLPSEKEQKKIEKLMRLALKIKKAIKAKRWTKSKFAEEMGIKNLSIVTKWLSGTNNFEIDTLMDIEYLLGISLLNEHEQISLSSYSYHDQKSTITTETVTTGRVVSMPSRNYLMSGNIPISTASTGNVSSVVNQ